MASGDQPSSRMPAIGARLAAISEASAAGAKRTGRGVSMLRRCYATRAACVIPSRCDAAHRRQSRSRASRRASPSKPHRPTEQTMNVDLARIEALTRELLLAIGEDPEREGLVRTPKRVAEAWRFLT